MQIRAARGASMQIRAARGASMQIMAARSTQAAKLLLLLLVVAVPSATAQGRSKIRIVQIINGCIGNISLNLEALREIVLTPINITTTTREPPTMTVTQNATTTEESGAFFEKLKFLDMESDEGSWRMPGVVGLVVPEIFQDEVMTMDCRNNTNCEKVLTALDEADAITAEVMGDEIVEVQVDRIYKADADVVQVLLEAPKDRELLEILLYNIAYLDRRMEMLITDKAAMQDLQDKMKTKETLGVIFGLIAGLLVFIGLTIGSYSCYQKTRKDPGVPDGLIIE